MDVLGLLSNISQIVDLLIKIGVMCSIYCVDVKNAPQDVRKLLKEVDRLTAVVKEVESLLRSPKGSSKLESQSLRQAIFDLRRLLAELVAKLDMGTKHVRATWPFRKRDIHEIVAAIERQKANILLNINIEQTSILLDVHQEFVLSKLRVAEAAAFDSNVDSEESYCLPGTRSHIIQQIQHWSTSPDGKSIFWLNGMAGTGKSTISRTIAQSFSNDSILGASFFFKRGEGDRGSTAFLFTTLTAQLVRRMPSLAPQIRQVLESEPQIHEKSLSDQFQMLILDPLKQYPGSWQSPDLLIVIDALDECGLEGSMRTLINILSKAQHTKNPRLKFFLTSRPELPIRLGFEDISGKYDNMLLAVVSTPTIEHDIELFMRHQLDTIKQDYNKSVSQHRKILDDWPGADVIQKLVASAIPLFIVAVTICRFLNDRRLGGPPHQLNRLLEYRDAKLSGLDMTYLPVLDRLTAGLSLSNKQQVMEKFIYLIGSVITLAKPLSIRSLAQILNVSTDFIEDQLDLLHSVLRVPSDLDTPVRLLHLSFRDFLLDVEKRNDLERYPFWVNEDAAHSTLFLQCINLLSTDGILREDICSLRLPGTLMANVDQKVINKHLPAAVQYACVYWTHHWVLSNLSICDGDQTHQFLTKYFLNWLEALSLIGRSAESIHMIDALLDNLEKDTNTHSITRFLQDAKRFILASLDTFSKAPLQIYSSALIFTPEASIVRKLFEASIPSWLSVLPRVQLHWDPCLVTLNNHIKPSSKILPFPTGNRCVSILPNGMLNVWHTRTTSSIGTYDGHLGLTSVAFSSDGRELLYLSGHEVLQIMEAETKSPVAEFTGHTAQITCAMFSGDTQQLASASTDGVLKIWDRETRQCLATHHYNYGSDDLVGFSPDGKSFLVISNHDTIRLLHTKGTSHRLLDRDHPQARIRSAVFSPDSKLLASSDGRGTLRFTDLASGITLFAEGADITLEVGLIFCYNGSRLISPMNGHAIAIWNTATAKCESLLEGHRTWITDIILSNDETKIASSSYDKTIKIWNISTGNCIATYNGHDERIINIAFTADERLLISADQWGNCKIWDTLIEAKSANPEGHENAVLEVVFSPDAEKIVTTSGDRTIKLWAAADGKCKATEKDHQLFFSIPLVIPVDMPSAPFDHLIQNGGLLGCSRSVVFSSDSSRFVSGTFKAGSTELRLWNVTTGSYELFHTGGSSTVQSLALAADDSTLLFTSRDGTAEYCDIKSKQLLLCLNGEAYGFSSSAVSPDGTHLILGCDDGGVRLFEVSKKKLKELSEPLGGPALRVVTSADGTKLAACSASTVGIWDMLTQACVASCEFSARAYSHICQLKFSPNNQQLAILYEKGEVKVDILDAETGLCVDRLSICGLANHMEFDSTGCDLITNVGTATIGSHAHSHNSMTTSREPRMMGIGLSKDGQWVTWNSQNMLCLPPTYRASASDIAASTIALGSRLGRLFLIGIDPSAAPKSQ
ncbi:hypothetical protein J3F83DRAFT_731217 [Trichoderma novae-zelandiae]